MSTSLRVALVSEHASPLALLGGVDAGGQNVHVASLSQSLARLGCTVVVHTRRDDPSLPELVRFAPGVWVHHVDAGPPTVLPKDELMPYMGEFGSRLIDAWSRAVPDVAHAHFWMSGMATMLAATAIGVPWVATFHALGTVKRRHQGGSDTSPLARIEIERTLAEQADDLADWAAVLHRVLDGGGRFLVMGNGGSAALAQHLTSELVGRFRDERPPFSAIALHADTSAVTAIANDYGFEEVFARQVAAHGRRGDVLLALTTSGRSPNLTRALRVARQLGIERWAMTGPTPNPLAAEVDRLITLDTPSAAAVQEGHQVAVHLLCRLFDSWCAESVPSPRLAVVPKTRR